MPNNTDEKQAFSKSYAELVHIWRVSVKPNINTNLKAMRHRDQPLIGFLGNISVSSDAALPIERKFM